MSNINTNDFTARKPGRSFLKQQITRKLRRFGQDEDGAMVALTLFMLILFLVMGGIGIDVMRHEMRRTHLAAVADAASLAGAAASTEAEAKAIVEDYFAKNGLSDTLQEFGEGDVNISLNSASVTVNADLTIDTYLMKLSGVKTLSTAATSTAQKRIPKLEIALVLDVSGSMSGTKLTNLKSAAKQFVTTILNGSDPGDAVISVIPFSFGVTPSDEMFNALTISPVGQHNYSTCIVFQDDDFNDTTIDPDTAYPQQIYTSRYDVSGNFNTLNSSWRSCYTDDYFRILPYSTNETALHNKIDSLQADGNTSGNEGIKWAAGLLDPAFQDVADIVDDGVDNDSSSTMPSEFDEPDTQKVIVMMGDGKNTSSYFFNDPNDLLDLDVVETHVNSDFRGPNSDLFEVTRTEQVLDYAYYIYNHNYTYYGPSYEYLCDYWYYDCVYESGGETVSTYYLYDHYGNNRYWDIENEEWLTVAEFTALEAEEGFIAKDRLNWEDAWGLMSPDYHKSITGSSTAYNDYKDQEKVTGTDKNGRMSSACTAIKAENVVVYTIGFEVSNGGTAETHLKNCASSETRYYRASVLNINDAFNSIAANVQNLRLTQ